MQQGKPDLVVSDLLDAYPKRKLIIKVADVHPGSLTLLEALDIMDACQVDTGEFERVMTTGRLREKARLMYAMAWVVARRAEPDLTYEEVCTYSLEVIGTPVNEKRAKDRAEAIVAVAALAGVSTEDAKAMTIEEVAAVSDLHRRRNAKRMRPHRRRA